MTVSVATITALESLIKAGVFASQAEADIDRTFRHGTRETFYSRILAAEGRDVADRRLTEWAEEQHLTLYASCVERIVRGIVALAKAKYGGVVDITECTSTIHTPIDAKYGSRGKLVVFNTPAPGCGCMQPTGSDIFGPYGELGLRAVILETGYRHAGLTTELSLVFPAWGTGRRPPKPGDFVIAKFDITGRSDGDKYSPYIRTDGGGADDFTDAHAFLKHLLGMKSIEGEVSATVHSSGIDQVIGFPGAEGYLADKLPELGDYFVALAEKLTTPHRH